MNWPAVLVALGVGARGAIAQRTSLPDLCSRETVATPSRSTYCMRLVPVPELRRLSGAVELHRAPSPFTVTVSAEGIFVYQPVIALHGLPNPSTLGPYAAYVAWAKLVVFRVVFRLFRESGYNRVTLCEVGKGMPTPEAGEELS